jgi:hypothetical protein
LVRATYSGSGIGGMVDERQQVGAGGASLVVAGVVDGHGELVAAGVHDLGGQQL